MAKNQNLDTPAPFLLDQRADAQGGKIQERGYTMEGILERRIHPRVRVTHPALYFSHIYPRPRVATTVDLSKGGTRIETPYSLIFGEHLDISIAIRPQVIQCRGKVVHIRTSRGDESPMGLRFEAGIQFEGMSEEDRQYLSEYLSEMMGEEGCR